MGKTVRAVSHVEDDHAADSNIEAAVNAALAQKEDMFEKLLQMQQSTIQACLQSFAQATNKRFDDLLTLLGVIFFGFTKSRKWIFFENDKKFTLSLIHLSYV